MDLYTAERLFVDRLRELEAVGRSEQFARAAEARGRLQPRVRIASWLRAAADRIDGRAMQRAV